VSLSAGLHCEVSGGGPFGAAQRLRERQEAAGSGLYNQDERGGCLLFARRNGSANCVLEPNGALPIGANRESEPTLEAVLYAMQNG
jgi:hypothetical protein